MLRAGLLPALAGGVLPGSQHWPQAVIRPGAHPARELRGCALDQRGVLVVDQFEELFTACVDERERAEFVSVLLAVPRVVVAVRADFYGRCAAYPQLSRALGDNHVLVGPMSRDELRRAIERPARRAGLVVEPELTDALLADVEGEPGALPLLSTTLLELWGRRDGQRLPLAAYARLGGVQGAVARLAEDAFVALAPGQQATARTLFLRLSDEDPNGAIVRRRIALDEQDAAVVAELTRRRLLTVSDGTVEVAHEALLREWPRLRGWLDEDIAGRRVHRRLREAAHVWDAGGREGGALYRGASLGAALDWAAEHGDELETSERAFLDAGRRASGAAQRRLRAGLAGVASLLVLALIAGLVAWQQRNEARARQTDADAQRLGAQALASDDLDLSLLLAREGVTLHDTAQTRGALLAALLKSPATTGVIRGVGVAVDLAVSPDGRTVLAASDDENSRLVDVPAGRSTAPAPLQGAGTANFDHTGERVVMAGPHAAILEARSWAEITPPGTLGAIYDASFSADDRELFVLRAAPSRTTELQRVDARGGGPPVPLGAPRLVFTGRVGEVGLPTPAVLATQDGRHVVTLVGGEVALRDAHTLAARWTLDNVAIEHMALSPNGRTLLLAGTDGSLDFVATESGAVHHVQRPRAVVQVAFSPDGRTAATAEADNRVLLWDVARRAVRDTFSGHAARVTALSFTHDGRTALSAGLDGKIMLWDIDGSRRLARAFAVGPAPGHPALSPDSRTLAIAHADGTISLVEPATLRTRRLRVADGRLGGIAFTDDRHLLVTVPRGGHGYGAVVDVQTGQPGTSRPGLGSPSAPSVDGGGRRMALVWHGAAQVRPLTAGRPTGRARFYRRSGGVVSVALSPDGDTLAVQTENGIEIVDVARMRLSGFLLDSDTTVTAPVFIGNGVVAAGSREGWVRLWSPATKRAISPRLAAHSGAVVALAISPDERTLASGGTDGSVRLFDVDTQQPLAARLPVAPDSPAFPVFSHEGAYLLATTASGHGYRWDIRPASWSRRACTIAGRRLTRSEWGAALPGRDYAPAC